MFVLLLCTNKSERTGNNKSKMTQILFPHCKLVIGLPVRATPNLEMRSNILSMSKKKDAGRGRFILGRLANKFES